MKKNKRDKRDQCFYYFFIFDLCGNIFFVEV